MKNLAAIPAWLLLTFCACKSGKEPAAEPTATAKPLEQSAVAAAPAPAPTPVEAPVVEVNTQSETSVHEEPVGGLKLGITTPLIEQILGKPTTTTKVELQGETGLYGTRWEFARHGITLELTSETEGGELTIASIYVTAPSEHKTKRGIGIGSTRAEVEKAYADVKTTEPVGDGSFVAGGSYGGVEFMFVNDRVSTIWVGVRGGE